MNKLYEVCPGCLQPILAEKFKMHRALCPDNRESDELELILIDPSSIDVNQIEPTEGNHAEAARTPRDSNGKTDDGSGTGGR